MTQELGIANPAPLGLCAFALTMFVLSCYNAGILGISLTTPPNVITGLSLFYAGFAQLLAGMWEFRTGNTYGATAFTSYACFWLAYAAILIPGFGIQDAYNGGHKEEFIDAVAIFLLAWTIFTFLMWLGTLKANVAISSMFALLTISLALLSISDFKRSLGFKRAGGFFGIVTAIVAWYTAFAGILTHENSYFVPSCHSRLAKGVSSGHSAALLPPFVSQRAAQQFRHQLHKCIAPQILLQALPQSVTITRKCELHNQQQ